MESLDNYVVDGFSSEEFLIHSLHVIVFGVCVCGHGFACIMILALIIPTR